MWKYMFSLVHRVRCWRAYREAGPLMTQSLYEPLSPDDEAKRDRLLAAFPELKTQFASFRRVCESIKLKEDQWAGDLLPALKEQLAMPARSRARTSHARAYAVAFVILVLFSAVLYAMFMLGGEPGPGFQQAEREVMEDETALSRASVDACDLVALGEPEHAATLLADAIESYPDDRYHADAILMLADIEYTYLQRYERAFEAFKRLEQEHRDIYNRNWELDKRVRLLSAALPLGFEPLRELEAAAHSGEPLRVYENILAQYPDKVWADEAMRHMGRLVARQSGVDPVDTVQMLQQVRGACDHPVALERIDLELGNYYCDSLDDPELARHYYSQAAASRHIALAAKAQEALARLE